MIEGPGINLVTTVGVGYSAMGGIFTLGCKCVHVVRCKPEVPPLLRYDIFSFPGEREYIRT